MGAIVSAILSWLFGAFARLFIVFSRHFLATKMVLVTLLMLILPIVINNIIYEILEILLNKANSIAGSQSVPSVLGGVIQFTGLAGYLMACFKIPESFSVVISAIATSFVLRSIPLVRW
jgi:hypothetical protein